MDNSNDILAMWELATAVRELSTHPKVKEYLAMMKTAEQLEKVLKEQVKGTQNSVEYFDPIKDANVVIAPTIKSKYNVDIDEVMMKFGQEYIETKQEVNVKMMVANPRCAWYLESVVTETVVPTKRVLKN